MRGAFTTMTGCWAACWAAVALAQAPAVEPFGPDVTGNADAGVAEAPPGIEAFEPVAEPSVPAPPEARVDAFEETPEVPTVTLHGHVRGDSSVDTRFDSPRNVPLAENVAEARLKGAVGADVKINSWLRLVLEGRAQLRFATQRDFDRPKAFFEPTLGDAFVDLYSSKVDWRIGNQRVAIGANTALAPSDALNPRDLRESIVLSELEDSVLPTFAIRAQGELGKMNWLVAYAPFFQPHRYFVFGQDEALMQPALSPAFDNRRLDPSIEDFVQERLLETRRPVPFAGDTALRLVSRGKVKVGASWVWVNEKLPRVTVDAELAALSRAQAAGKPVDSAAALSVLNRLQAGQTLFRGTYGRQHLFSVEGSSLVGPGQLDVDVTYTPRQTFVDPGFAPLDKAAFTWVLGYSQASESPVFYSINYLGMAVPDVGAQQQLMLLEPATAVGAARTAFFHLFIGAVAVPVWKQRFELQLRAAFEPVQLSFAAGPRVTFQAVDRLKVWLAGEIYQGASWTPFGYFARNNKVVVGARYDVF